MNQKPDKDDGVYRVIYYPRDAEENRRRTAYVEADSMKECVEEVLTWDAIIVQITRYTMEELNERASQPILRHMPYEPPPKPLPLPRRFRCRSNDGTVGVGAYFLGDELNYPYQVLFPGNKNLMFWRSRAELYLSSVEITEWLDGGDE